MEKAVAFAVMLVGALACAGSRPGGSPASPSRGGPPDPWFAALPNDARIAEVTPGRFAATYDYFGMASCSHSWGSTTSRATVVLNLAADGTATGCRGRNFLNVVGSNDEFVATRKGLPHRPPEETKHVEQQGMRGRWRRDGRAIVVDLEPDAGICPTRTEGPKARRSWHLRCAFIEPTGKGASVRQPVLACAWRNDSEERAASTVNYDVQAGYVTDQVIPGYWMLLAPGAGLRLTERKIGEGLYGPSEMSWQAAIAPIAFDDWSATGP
jgi:hypothetical protein